MSRPLTLPRHFRRNVGRLLTVTLTEGGTVTGRVTAVDDDGVRLTLPTDDETVLPWPDVVRAAVTAG